MPTLRMLIYSVQSAYSSCMSNPGSDLLYGMHNKPIRST